MTECDIDDITIAERKLSGVCTKCGADLLEERILRIHEGWVGDNDVRYQYCTGCISWSERPNMTEEDLTAEQKIRKAEFRLQGRCSACDRLVGEFGHATGCSIGMEEMMEYFEDQYGARKRQK